MDQTALRIVALVLAGCLVAEQTFADGYRAALVHPLHAPESARSLWRSQALAARNVSAEFQPHAAAMDDVPVRCLDVVRPAGRFRTSGYSLFPLKLPAIAKSAAFLLALRTVLPAAELTSGQPDQSWILIPVIVLGLTVGTLFIGLLKVFRSPPEQRAPVAPKAALGRGTWRRLWPWIGLVVGLPLATAVIDERIGGSLPDDPMAKLRQIRDGWKKDPDPQKLAAGLRELARQTPGPHPDLMLADYLTWSLRLSYDGDRARLDKDQVVRAVCDVLVACQWSAAMYRVWPEVFYNAQRATSITVRHAFLSLARMGDDGKPLMAAMIPTALHPDGPELRPADLRRLHRFLTVLMARYRNQNDTEAAWDALLGETSRLPADCSVRALQVLAKIPSPNRTVVNHHVQRLLWLRTTPDVKARRQIHEAAVDLLTAIAKRNRNWDDSLQGAWLAVLGEFGGVSVEPVLEALRAMRKNLDVPDYWIAAEARRLLKQEWPPEESSDATIRVWAALAEIWAASPRFYYELGQALDEVGTRAEMEMHLGAERDRHIESFQNALDRLKPYEAQNVIRLVRAVVTVSPSVILVPAGMAPLTRDEIGRYLDLLSPDGDEQLLVEMESLKGDYRRVEHWIQEKAPNYIGRHLLFVFNWVLTGLALDAARDEQRSARLLDAVQFVTDQLGLLDRPVGSSLDHQSDIAPTPAEFSTVSAEAIDQLAAQIKKTKRARGNAMMRLVNGVLKGDPNLLLDSTDPEAASGQPLSLQLALYLDLLARESQAESVRTKLMADPRWSQPAGELWAAKGPLFCDVPPLFGLNWLVTELAIRSSTVLAPAHLKQMRFASEQLGEWLQALRLNRWGNVPDPAEPWDEAGLGPPLNSSEIGAVLRERRNISWQARVDSRDPRVLAPDLIAVRIAKPFNGRPAGAESEILIGDAFQQLEAGRLRARRNSNGFVTFILDEPPYEFPAYSSRENPDLARLPVLTEANAGRALDRSGIVVALSMAEARGLEFEDVVVGHKLTRTPIFYLKEIADLDARKSARNKRLRVYWHPDSGQFHYFMDEPKQHMELPGILSAGLPILVGASPILSFLRHVISPVMADLPAVVVGMIAAASLAVFHPAVRSRAAFLFHAA